MLLQSMAGNLEYNIVYLGLFSVGKKLLHPSCRTNSRIEIIQLRLPGYFNERCREHRRF
ncbi:hypothetical protein D9M68_827450 [compost metagenome]